MARHFGTMGAAPVSISLPSGLTIAERSKVLERLRTPTVESDDQATGHVLLDGKVLRFEVMGSAIRFRFTGVTHPLRPHAPNAKAARHGSVKHRETCQIPLARPMQFHNGAY
jgi:hypothetical protein